MSDEEASTILIVDDNPQNVKILERQLGRFGYRILKAYDGEAALSAVSEGRPDVVLLDVMMPRLNGFEVCERLKRDERNSRIQIIILSAKGELED
ncbi:MAG: response regulator [Planctomycetes bacterium]|nr:response regulator [Planctomycetota bacterium]